MPCAGSATTVSGLDRLPPKRAKGRVLATKAELLPSIWVWNPALRATFTYTFKTMAFFGESEPVEDSGEWLSSEKRASVAEYALVGDAVGEAVSRKKLAPYPWLGIPCGLGREA